MRKKILFINALVFIILITCLTYLSIYGIRTDGLNNLIKSKVKEYNSKLVIQIDEVYIKLNLRERAININTKNASLIAESNLIKITNIDINLNLLKFLKNEKSIKNIKIKSSNNLIKDVIPFLNSIGYDISLYAFNSEIKKGLLNFELDTKFDNSREDIVTYYLSGM